MTTLLSLPRGAVGHGNGALRGLLLVSGLAPKVSAFAMKDGTPAGDIASPGELAASPFVTSVRGVPQVVLVARDIATGTRVLAVRRLIDPPMNNQMPPLPGAVTAAPAPGGPTSPPPGGAAPPPAGSAPSGAPPPR